ncbi:MAG: hypothetical protein RL173_1917 [Fibrobacterota bacterium]|jgi:hypothetical protein
MYCVIAGCPSGLWGWLALSMLSLTPFVLSLSKDELNGFCLQTFFVFLRLASGLLIHRGRYRRCPCGPPGT